MLSADVPARDRFAAAERAARLILAHLATLAPATTDLATVLANQALIVLVTGYEGYCEGRFIELIQAGWPVDTARLDRVLVPPEKQGALASVPAELDRRSPGYARLLIRRYRVNFQAYRNNQRVYAAAFGIAFGHIVASDDLLTLQRLLEFRHGVVHVSPFFAELADGHGAPLRAGPALAGQALAVFGGFVQALATRTATPPA